MRTVILHYHIYKNAGTSFDHVLTHNFGERHEAFDGPYPFFTIDQEQLDRIVMRRPQAVAFSSHQIVLPAPSSLDYRGIAAIFVRNPFLRIASIYRFKRGPEDDRGVPIGNLEPDQRRKVLKKAQLPAELADQVDMTSTAIAARATDFAGWLEHCLNTPTETVHVSNAQTRFLSAPYRTRPPLRRTPHGLSYDLPTALRTLAGVELLGRTEEFEPDVARFADILTGYGITLTLPDNMRHNVTEHHEQDTARRVRSLLSSLPPALRARIEAANAQDMALYDRACQLIERDHRV